MTHVAEHVYTPSELNREVRLHIETGFPRIWLEGEVSNLSRPPSGHLYFTLKDERAQVRCALFRSAAGRSGTRVENGMQVLAKGRISLYEPRGDFQMIVDAMQDAGEGALQRQFEALKKKLGEEGLFDAAHKKTLPPYPLKIAVITSPTGAAVRDILHVFARRWPLARIRVYPVSVQGSAAPREISAALAAANRHDWAEVLLLGRGGGSLEDLAGFNDESVARAVFASKLPVVSAVGHETDFSICDFVADIRAPTPSAAAELTAPDQAVLRQALSRVQRQLESRMRVNLQRGAQGLDQLGHRLRQRHPAHRLEEQTRRLGRLRTSLVRTVRHRLEKKSHALDSTTRRLAASRPDRQLAALAHRVAAARRALLRLALADIQRRSEKLRDLARTLHAVSPLDVIGRGYAILTATESGTVITSVSQVASGDRIEARLGDGRLDCTVRSVR